VNEILPTFAFDDVSLVPGYSEILPSQVNVGVILGEKVRLALPILSAAMDTVTESKTAIVMAQNGGLGIIHKNLTIEFQAREVKRVKTLESHVNGSAQAALDTQGRLLCGAAIGPGDDLAERSKALVDAGVDVLVLDTAHGHSKKVAEAVVKIKNWYPQMYVIAGNIVTSEAAEMLAQAGADAVKVGVGPGSICTTRIVSGVGVPQFSAIRDVAAVAKKVGVKVIADGGIKYSGDMVKAMAAGADAVMIGSLFAGTEEAPGERVVYQGREFKSYRGMGSLEAMQNGSKDRYAQADVAEVNKLVPEGIEGRVPYRGLLSSVIYQLIGGMRTGMGYVGAATIDELHQKARFVGVSASGLKESHVHDVTIAKEAPNYHQSNH